MMINFLKEKGELDYTIIVVTADNGMPFPSAKANLQEYGTHVPLAICWPKKTAGDRTVNDLVSMIDLAPTFLEVANVKDAPVMTGNGDIFESYPRFGGMRDFPGFKEGGKYNPKYQK
jgi:uncharacterized sulfatase